jgi:sulfatase-like protein
VARDVEQVQAGPAGAGQDGGGLRRRPLRDRLQLWALVELFVLCGFAIAQPLLEVTGHSPEFFLFRRADRLDIVALVFGLILLPALGIWTAEVLLGLVSERLRRLHLAAVAGLVSLVAIQVAKKLTGLRGPAVVAVALVVGAVAAVVYARASWPRLWLRYLTPAPLVFALVFLLLSPSSRLVLPARAEATAAAAPAVAAGRQPPLVMILFDEFPLKSLLDSKGQIDRRVYPNFAALADQSTWYRNATGISGYTPWAMPAMLTGRYPAKVKAPSYTEYPDNMLTLFGRSYDLKAYETISQLCPPSRCPLSDGHLDQAGLGAVLAETARSYRKLISPYDAAEDPASFADQTDAEAGRALRPTFRFDRMRLNQPSRFNDFLAGLEDSQRPTMHFLHLLLPHPPWRYQPSGTEYNDKSFAVAHKTEEAPLRWSSWPTSATCSRSPTPTGWSARSSDKLKAEGMWDKSLVVMGADHGQGWVPGEQPRYLSANNAPDLMWVPQFIKAPGQRRGRVDDRNWEQVDLLPTIADLVGIQVPWRMDGLPQAGPPARRRSEKWFYDLPGRQEVRDGPTNFTRVLAGVTDTLARAQEGPRGLYRFGKFADLIYRDPATVGPIGGSPASATLDDQKQYRRVDPASGRVPALVSGTLAVPPPTGSTVLVTVNGRVGGASELFPGRPGQPADHFGVITPDFLWQPGDGHHQLQLYLLAPGSQPWLQPVALS